MKLSKCVLIHFGAKNDGIESEIQYFDMYNDDKLNHVFFRLEGKKFPSFAQIITAFLSHSWQLLSKMFFLFSIH
jgi:hypothetical protein